ncbi:MAG TPA: S53 family peptidase [Acidimicrobiales bacterium]|nr:S53 family peptidase [Acidimicrobiales bacterium]
MSSLVSRSARAGVAVVAAGALAAAGLASTPHRTAVRTTGKTFSIGVPIPMIHVGSHGHFMGATPPGPGSCGCYEPAQFEAAYDLAPLYAAGDNGKGETIVIVDSFGSKTIKADLATFDTGFKLPAPPSFKIITPEGAVGSNSSWATETTLDVEYSHAIAPDANIILVETPVSETVGAAGFKQIVAAENYVISNKAALGITGGAVISQSFGTAEQTFGSGFASKIAAFRSAYQAAQTAGVTVLAASGDDGATGCSNAATPCSLYSHRVNSWPSSDPLVTSVGGLQFSISTTTPFHQTAAPVVWNDGSPLFGGAGGGGDSAAFTIPTFQSSVSTIVGKWRGTPDVSMSASVAGGAEIYQTGLGWTSVGGTSEATPEFAGIVAIADQVAGKGLGDLDAALYGLEAAGGTNGIVDVTSGNNSFNGVTGYTAVKGYDMASGIGTIDAKTFIPALVAEVGKVG